MNRITRANLDAMCAEINRTAGTPTEPWTRHGDGRLTANIGCYHLSGAYGGWSLEQMASEGGGVHAIFSGYLPKRELYERMRAYLAGMRAREATGGIDNA